jgi:hypothetical protein
MVRPSTEVQLIDVEHVVGVAKVHRSVLGLGGGAGVLICHPQFPD